MKTKKRKEKCNGKIIKKKWKRKTIKAAKIE